MLTINYACAVVAIPAKAMETTVIAVFSSRFIQFHFRRVLFHRYFRHRVSLLPNIHPQLFLIQWNLFSMMVVITTATTTVTAIQNNADIV